MVIFFLDVVRLHKVRTSIIDSINPYNQVEFCLLKNPLDIMWQELSEL